MVPHVVDDCARAARASTSRPQFPREPTLMADVGTSHLGHDRSWEVNGAAARMLRSARPSC